MEGCDVYVFHAEYVALMQAGIVMSMKSRCEPKKDEEEPEVKQVGA